MLRRELELEATFVWGPLVACGILMKPFSWMQDTERKIGHLGQVGEIRQVNFCRFLHMQKWINPGPNMNKSPLYIVRLD